MNKIENLEIKEYLIDFVTEKCQQCDLFSKVFGKNFAKYKLKQNIKKVYTNKFDENRAAYFANEGKYISFCTNSDDTPPLTVSEIKNNPKLVFVMVHEAVHGIFNKGFLECRTSGLDFGTGILEVTKQGREYGRGLNEGLTNWICEKLGITGTCYEEETNFVKKLELALGPIAIMKMAKGNIKKNVSKQLQMNPEESYAFLGLVDEVHAIKRKIENYNLFISILDKVINIDKYTAKEQEKIKRAFENMKYLSPDYYEFQNSMAFLDFSVENGNSLESQLKFLKISIEEDEKRVSKVIKDIDRLIFDKYFKKDFECQTNKARKFRQSYRVAAHPSFSTETVQPKSKTHLSDMEQYR